MQGTFDIRFAGVTPVTTCEYPIEWGRKLIASMRKAIPEARTRGGNPHVDFPLPGEKVLTLAFTPDEADARAKALEEGIVRAEPQQHRGAVHPIGKVEVIERDPQGEMAKIETRYKF